MILPSMGVVTEIIACFSRKRIFGYHFVAFSSIAIAVFGFLVWAHHMFVAGISVYSALVFSFLSYAVALPSAIKVFNWTATLYKGSIHYDAPMLYALASSGFSPSAASPDYFCRRWASTCTSPTPISSWRTSTTSWWEAR
jgi:cytochrome c oxidase subunit I